MKRFLSFFLVLCLLFTCLSFTAFAEDGAYYQVTGGKLHMREAAGKNAEIAATLPTGTLLQIIGTDGDWAQVVLENGSTGWAMRKYLQNVGSLTPIAYAQVQNNGNFVNVRSESSYAGSVIAKCQSGETVEIISRSGSWAQVKCEGVLGYMDASFLTEVSKEDANALAAAALRGPNPFQLDVSGLTDASLEWGQTESLVNYDEDFSYQVQYPKSDNDAFDTLLSAWAQSQVNDFFQDFQENHALAGQSMNEDDQDTESNITSAELTVSYNAYLLDERYASVMETGWYTNSEIAHSMDVIFAATLDKETGTVYQGTALFTDPQAVLDLVVSKLAAIENDAITFSLPAADLTWLDTVALTHDGVQVILHRGLCVPSYLGTQQITLPFSEVGKYLTISTKESAMPAVSSTIDPTKPMIALTFDDGPSEYTQRILAVLGQYGCHATFCMVGNRMDNYQDVVAAVNAAGCEIATHTWNHKQLTNLSYTQVKTNLQKAIDKTREMTGQTITMLRPPYGSTNGTVRNVCAELGLIIVNWSIDTEDWKTRNAQTTYDNIMSQVENGSIILCHDLYEETAQAMERVIPALVNAGYQILSVEELYSFHVNGVEPGKIYSHLDPSNIVIK